jgi:cytochrome c oxidase subunit 3
MCVISNNTPFHLVKPSAWPFVTALFVLNMVLYIVIQFHYSLEYNNPSSIFIISMFFVVWSAFSWWFDVMVESTHGGHFTSKVRWGIAYGFILFIASEIMFFVSFFWTFFHSSLSPVFNIGGVWPPAGIDIISPWGVPLLNTLILLTSGATVTRAHHALLKNKFRTVILNLDLTLILAILFTKLQLFEYTESSFSISDSIYGSIFYLMTGFHGFHVLIGTIFLFVCLIRYDSGHFSRVYHLGFEAAIWYWHFVDVVWIFLFICLYWWGGSITTITLFI